VPLHRRAIKGRSRMTVFSRIVHPRQAIDLVLPSVCL